MAERSTHVALLTLWFMQATLNDLAVAKRDTPSFAVCQRVLHCCHEIIFGDPPPQNTGPYSGARVTLASRFSRRRVRPQAAPAIMGIVTILASVPGMPSLVNVAGEMAIEQGRAAFEGGISAVEEAEDAGSPAGNTLMPRDEADDQELEVGSPDDMDATPQSDESPEMGTSATPPKPISTRWAIHAAARTSPALPLHLVDIPRSRASIDPLGQLDHTPPNTISTPSQSSPSVNVMKRHRLGLYNSVDAVMHRYDLQSQMSLLRGHYCRSEVCPSALCSRYSC
jgi:hypothetical protein